MSYFTGAHDNVIRKLIAEVIEADDNAKLIEEIEYTNLEKHLEMNHFIEDTREDILDHLDNNDIEISDEILENVLNRVMSGTNSTDYDAFIAEAVDLAVQNDIAVKHISVAVEIVARYNNIELEEEQVNAIANDIKNDKLNHSDNDNILKVIKQSITR